MQYKQLRPKDSEVELEAIKGEEKYNRDGNFGGSHGSVRRPQNSIRETSETNNSLNTQNSKVKFDNDIDIKRFPNV